MSTAERILCAKCNRSLGVYDVLRGDGKPLLSVKRLPQGMVVWRRKSSRPQLFTRIRTTSWIASGNETLVVMPKYEWGCSCGANPVWRADKLLERLDKWGGAV